MTTPKPSSAPDSFLAAELEREYKNWRTATRAYGFTYYFSRVSLIILTAVVAAKESLADSFAGTHVIGAGARSRRRDPHCFRHLAQAATEMAWIHAIQGPDCRPENEVRRWLGSRPGEATVRLDSEGSQGEQRLLTSGRSSAVSAAIGVVQP